MNCILFSWHPGDLALVLFHRNEVQIVIYPFYTYGEDTKKRNLSAVHAFAILNSLCDPSLTKIVIYLAGYFVFMKKLSTAELNRMTVEEYKSSKRLPLVVVLDHVRSGHNVGSVFRTCDAFGIAGLYLCGITPCPPNREVMKTALGSHESVDWLYDPDTEIALGELRKDGFEIIFAEHTTESISLQQFIPSKEKKYALVFGNEVEGIKSELLPLADQVIEIPQFGTKHSFNISVAAGIVLWDVWNKLR